MQKLLMGLVLYLVVCGGCGGLSAEDGTSLLLQADQLLGERANDVEAREEPRAESAPPVPSVRLNVESLLADTKTTPTTRDVFKVMIRVYYQAPPGVLSFGTPQFEVPQGMRVLRSETTSYATVVGGEASEVLQTTFHFKAYQSGDFSIGPFTIGYRDRVRQEEEQAHVGAVSVTVVPYQPTVLERLQAYRTPIVIGVVFLLLGSVGGWYAWRRYVGDARQPPPPDPREKYQKLLEAAKRARMNGDHGEFYSVLLKGVKQAWAERIAEPLPPPQSNRFSEQVQNAGGNEEMAERLRSFMKNCEVYRFAPMTPPANEMDEAEREARSLLGLE